MCACGFKNGARNFLANKGYSTLIGASSFVSPQTRTYSDFMFWRCISESKFKNALNTVQVQGENGQPIGLGDWVKTDDQVKNLAQYADSGEDIKVWNVSLKQLLGSIKFDQSELDNASCKVAFAND